MTKFVKTSLAGVALAVALGGAAQAQETVAIGELSWDGQRAISYVMKAVIELRLGSKAEIKKAEAAVVMASMDKGDGGLDVYADMWMPNQTEKWNKYIDEAGTVDHNAAPYPGTQAIFVPTYIAEQGVRSIDDLKKPEVAAMFDSDGNGKGEYWPGAPGWNSTNRWAIKFKSYGLDDLWEAVPVDDAIFKSQLDGAYRKKDAILFYYWTPEWIHAAYDITPIEEPARYEGCEEVYQTADREDWLEASKFDCVSNDAEVWNAFSMSLHERNPKAACFLKNMVLNPDMVNGWILRIGRDKEDPQDMAEEWVEANPEIVDVWLEGCGA